jgi:hypothetical protein
MSDAVHIVRGTCPEHGPVLLRSVAGIRPKCPKCFSYGRDTRKPLANLEPYGASDWEAARTTPELRACDDAFRRNWSPRRHRLAFCALARLYFAQSRQYWLWKAVEVGEQWADTGTPPEGANDIFLRFGGPTRTDWKPGEWTWLAVQCVSGAHEEEREGFDGEYDWGWHMYRYPDAVFSLSAGTEAALQPAPAIVHRELVPNPFVPLAWKPEWFTSTVREMAEYIYASREFSAMPILADALQEAGCEDAQVLTHCRANRPHARGCWVLDAILGKA